MLNRTNSRADGPHGTAGNSALQAATWLLERCLAGQPPDDVPEVLLSEENTALLFRVVIESLSDHFDPRLTQIYVKLFSGIIERVYPALSSMALQARYQRIREPRRFTGDPARIRTVFVFSRVTLGADVAVTSVLLDAALKKFPEGDIYFVGPVRNWEMFAGEPRIKSLPLKYARNGGLAERLSLFPDLSGMLNQQNSVIIDPDSRLTQLGLLPVGRDQDYYLFESRSYGGDSAKTLSSLAGNWAEETFGVFGARPFIRPAPPWEQGADVAVNLGVGENPAKRLPDPFESRLLQYLSQNFRSVLVDLGAGDDEARRVKLAVAACTGGDVRVCSGPFAGFAARIARSNLYVGYDSAGSHAAAACSVPMVAIFAGVVTERMFARWSPSGSGKIRVIRADAQDPDAVFVETCKALEDLRIAR